MKPRDKKTDPQPGQKASKVSSAGKVSALCFKRPHAIDLARESWTIRNEGVTCEECVRLSTFTKVAR